MNGDSVKSSYFAKNINDIYKTCGQCWTDPTFRFDKRPLKLCGLIKAIVGYTWTHYRVKTLAQMDAGVGTNSALALL